MKLFSYFPANIHKVQPLGLVDLHQFHEAIRNPKEKIKQTFKLIRKASSEGNVAEKQRLKEMLYYFTPAVKVKNKRRYSEIDYFTGLLPFDFDKLDVVYAKEFKEYLFNEHKFIISAWLSASGQGVRFLVKIPVCNTVEEFKSFFNAVSFYDPANFAQYNGYDQITKNPIQPVFLSHDPDILVRENPDTWFIRHVENKDVKQIKGFKASGYENSRVESIIKKSLSRINNEGHWILRATSYTIGGYVAGGEIAEHIAINIINNCIDNHEYLKQKASIYKKTALSGINKGKEKPLHL